MSEYHNNKDIGKCISFYEMLNIEKEIDKILIPKIQRDYAQGREGMKNLRKRFLGSLFEIIDQNTQKEIILDFVFGQKEKNDKVIFYPVDGQQRLTTLFLLHLYVGKRSGEDISFLSKFSYETRDSSKQFCKRLIEIPGENFNGIKEYIRDQWWFTGLWRTDPTIMSMINMLDEIDSHYRQVNGVDFSLIWSNLIKRVKFWRLYLSDLKTTDELYIKMNSRGKPLTNFEHFKAMLDDLAGKNGTLSRKIDTDWTELLWRYRDKGSDFKHDKYMENGLDKCFYNLLSLYLKIEGCKKGLIDFSENGLDILELADIVLKPEHARKIMERFDKIMGFFCKKDPKSGTYVHDPKTFFEQYIQDDNEARSNINNINNQNIKVYIVNLTYHDLLKEVCEKGIEIDNKRVLYIEAFFQFANISQSGNQYNSSIFLDRLRILRNLIENTYLHANEFKGNLLFVDNFITNGDHTKDMADEFTKIQKEQETQKNEWMLHNPDDKPYIKNLENHWLLLGNLNVIFDNQNPPKINVQALKNFAKLFNNSSNYPLIEKALLTIGDYASSRFDIKSYGGDLWDMWRDVMRSGDKQTSCIVQKFLTSLNSFTESDLMNVVKRYLNEVNEKTKRYEWRYYLIEYECIRNARRGKYRHEEGTKYSYKKLNANGGGRSEYYWNPYNLALKECLEKKGIICAIDDYGGKLYLTQQSFSIDIKENTIEMTDSNDSKKTFEIEQHDDGIDKVDRIKFTSNIIDKISKTSPSFCFSNMSEDE